MKIIFYDTLLGFGGSHTLLYRMAKWLFLNGIKVEIISSGKIDLKSYDLFKDVNVIIHSVPDYNLKELNKVLKDNLNDDPDLFIINFTIDKWLDIEVLKKKHHYNLSNIIYDIHPETFYKGVKIKNFYLKKIIKKIVKQLLIKIYANDSIISMDENNIDSVRKYLNFSKSDYNPIILRLPMFCDSSKNCQKVIKDGYTSNIVMTASRADFPYKGYIIGLIDDFCKLKETKLDLRLWIITEGPSENLIKDKIDNLPMKIKKDIKIYNWMKYSDLLSMMERCKLYIGMGTTVLDASLRYKPAIPTAFGTFQNMTCGLFSSNPTKIGVNLDDSKEAFTLIENILNQDFDSYKSLCISSYNAVKDNYDIEKIMRMLLSIKVKNCASILKDTECLIHIIHLLINRCKYTNKKVQKDFAK